MALRDYAEANGIFGDDFEEFKIVIRIMEGAHLEYAASKLEKN